MENRQQGFTITELVAAAAVVGVLAAIAIPAYSKYSIRSQVAEGFNLSAGARSAATAHYQGRGAFATNNTLAGLAAPDGFSGTFVTRVEIVASGAIEVTYGNFVHAEIADGVLTMTPADIDGNVIWNCTGDAKVRDIYLPRTCAAPATGGSGGGGGGGGGATGWAILLSLSLIALCRWTLRDVALKRSTARSPHLQEDCRRRNRP